MTGNVPIGSDDYRRLNPHLFPNLPKDMVANVPNEGLKVRLKRIRQSRDKLNVLETRWQAQLSVMYGTAPIFAQAVRFRLANGIWYKPDFVVALAQWHCYEVKGPKSWRGGFENLKVAATQYPSLCWILVWEQDGEWHDQQVLP
jgi:hypothetical protein